MSLQATGYAGQLLFNSLSLNQDSTCFSLGMKDGFEVYSTEPLRRITKSRDFPTSLSQVQMLWKTNLMAFIVDSPSSSPQFQENSVCLYDCQQNKTVLELRFEERVVALRVSVRRIFVSTENRVFIFRNHKSVECIKRFETYNPNGVLCVSYFPNSDKKLRYVCCFPKKDTRKGCMEVVFESLEGKKITKIGKPIECHVSPIHAATLSQNGSFLATVSKKGTLVRVFNTLQSQLKQTFRRGSYNANIYSLSFRKDNKFLVLSSDSKTIHIFQLSKCRPATESYFFTKFSLVGGAPYPPSIVFFSKVDRNIIYICDSERKFTKIRFDDIKKGSLAKLEWTREFKDTL